MKDVGTERDSKEDSKTGEEMAMDVDKSPTQPDDTSKPADELASGTTEGVSTISPGTEQAEPQRPTTSSGWLSWFGRTQVPTHTSDEARDPPAVNIDRESAEQNAVNGEQSAELSDEPSALEQPDSSKPTEESSKADEHNGASDGDPHTTKQSAPASSWFALWPSRGTTQAEPVVEPDETPQLPKTSPAAKSGADVDMADAPASLKSKETTKAPSAGSTWAFWSRDSRTSVGGVIKQPAEPGELAVFGEGSESHPEPANSPDSKADAQSKQRPATPASIRAKNNKRARPDSMEIESGEPVTPKSDQKQINSTKEPKQDGLPKDATPAETPTKVKTPVAKDTAGTALPANLLLPSFTSTYGMKENPSIIRQIADFLLRTRQPPANHVYRVKEPPRVKKALAIGIHGLFPASYLKPIIGQPTGTSLRFANLAAEAIRRWTDDNGQEDCEIEKVALEGEGKIFDRVNNLWTLLLNWIDQIRRSDLIILACHSQGVPVTIMLLAKLIDLGIVTNAKIGVCAMG